MPNLIFISYCKTLTAVCITVLLSQSTHKGNSLSCCRTSLKGNSLKLLNHKKTVCSLKLSLANSSGLTNCKLFLVHTRVSHIKESVSRNGWSRNSSLLNNVSHIITLLIMQKAPVDSLQLTRFVSFARLHRKPGTVI